MAKSSKPVSFLDECKSLDQRSWFDKLPASDRKEMLEVRRAFQAGELNTSAASILRLAVKRFGITTNQRRFRDWINEGKA